MSIMSGVSQSRMVISQTVLIWYHLRAFAERPLFSPAPLTSDVIITRLRNSEFVEALNNGGESLRVKGQQLERAYFDTEQTAQIAH